MKSPFNGHKKIHLLGVKEPSKEELLIEEVLGLTEEMVGVIMSGIIQLLAFQNMRIAIIEKDLNVKFRNPTQDEIMNEEERIAPIIAAMFGVEIKKNENQEIS